MSDLFGTTTEHPQADRRPTDRMDPLVDAYRHIGLDPRDYASMEGAVLAGLAVVLFVVGAVMGYGPLLVVSGIATLAAVGFTLAASIRSLSAPTPTE